MRLFLVSVLMLLSIVGFVWHMYKKYSGECIACISEEDELHSDQEWQVQTSFSEVS
jgi:hypothetical protein